jgi:hypothetical protein
MGVQDRELASSEFGKGLQIIPALPIPIRIAEVAAPCSIPRQAATSDVGTGSPTNLRLSDRPLASRVFRL